MFTFVSPLETPSLTVDATRFPYREEAENASELAAFPIEDQRGPDMLTAQGTQIRHYIHSFADAFVHSSPCCLVVVD